MERRNAGLKLLFLLYAFYPDFEANSLIIYHLAKAFTENGHEVHVLPMKAYFNEAGEEQWEGIQLHRIQYAFDKGQVKQFLSSRRFASALRLSLALIKDSFQKKEYQALSWSYYSYRRFQDILKEQEINIVINVCYPLEACLPVLKYIEHKEKSFRWIIYMLDPFATNFYYLSKYPKEELLAFQSKIFDLADRIVVTPLMMKELKSGLTQEQCIKYLALNFPKVMRLKLLPKPDDIHFDHNYINCVYVGKFNKDTRNPWFLFRLFDGLEKEHIRLHILGEEREPWLSYLTAASGNILFYGSKSKDAALNAELRSNILINLGNSIPNQLPSKLLEYISTGKPIVNLYKLADCPSLAYMKHYPIQLSMQEKQADFQKIKRRFRHFLKRNRRRNISYSHIQRKFYYCTLNYVCCEFLNLFDEIMEED